jgi:hypothetical protein
MVFRFWTDSRFIASIHPVIEWQSLMRDMLALSEQKGAGTRGELGACFAAVARNTSLTLHLYATQNRSAVYVDHLCIIVCNPNHTS